MEDKIRKYLDQVKIEGISLSEFTFPGDFTDTLAKKIGDDIMVIVNNHNRTEEVVKERKYKEIIDMLLTVAEKSTKRYIDNEGFLLYLAKLSPWERFWMGGTKEIVVKRIREILDKYNF